MIPAGAFFSPVGVRGVVWGHSELPEQGLGFSLSSLSQQLSGSVHARVGLRAWLHCASSWMLREHPLHGGKWRIKINNMQVKIPVVVLHIYLIAKFSVGSSRNSGIKAGQNCSKPWK